MTRAATRRRDGRGRTHARRSRRSPSDRPFLRSRSERLRGCRWRTGAGDKGKFHLEIPLDATDVGELGPEPTSRICGSSCATRPARRGRPSCPLGKDRRGSAGFDFDDAARGLSVYVGPATATDEELLQSQTLKLDVRGRLWAKRPQLTLQPDRHRPVLVVLVAALVPRVRDPRPRRLPRRRPRARRGGVRLRRRLVVPLEQHPAGRLRHDRRQRRVRDPVPLVLRLVAVVVVEPARLGSSTRSSRSASGAVLADQARSSRSARSAISPALTALAGLLRDEDIPTARPIEAADAARLEAIRTRLMARLPASDELTRLHVWPWWPWWPWWDCTPDIIFKVRQACERAAASRRSSTRPSGTRAGTSRARST